MGLSKMGSKCLFVTRVNGFSLLPVPPASTIPFMQSSPLTISKITRGLVRLSLQERNAAIASTAKHAWFAAGLDEKVIADRWISELPPTQSGIPILRKRDILILQRHIQGEP